MSELWSNIAVTRQIAASLPGVAVLGGSLALRPSAAADSNLGEADWRMLHARWRGTAKAALAAVAEIASYRDFYRTLGLDPARTPPSVENIITRFLLKPDLTRFPSIHPIVDAVNVAAVETLIPLGAFDAACVCGTVTLDRTLGGELFQPLGAETRETLPSGTLVLRDDEKVLSRFCYRDSEAQKITPSTKTIMLLGCAVPGISDSSVRAALDRAMALLARSYEIQPIRTGMAK